MVEGGGYCPVYSLPFSLTCEVIFQRLGDPSCVYLTVGPRPQLDQAPARFLAQLEVPSVVLICLNWLSEGETGRKRCS